MQSDKSPNFRSIREANLPEYKKNFIHLIEKTGALRVGGDSTLKSKRQSPYFIDIGGFNAGFSTAGLASAYASTIEEHFSSTSNLVLYGIPEKGVSLSPSITVALHQEHEVISKWCFTRKEEKKMGEAAALPMAERSKGMLVGFIPDKESNILLIDDVFTTGKAKYDAIEFLNKLIGKPNIIGLVIAVDRQEVGINGPSAIEEFTAKTGIPVYPILKAADIYRTLAVKETNPETDRIGKYLRVYGTKKVRESVASEPKKIISIERSIIPACDMPDIEKFERMVRETSVIPEIGGYKVGFELGLTYGLPKVVEAARKHTEKPIIYDHQKAATDIPDTGKNFASVMKNAGIDTVIFFPQSGPETERAWIYRAMEQELGIIVGGIMTHEGYLQSEGGFIVDDAALEIYRIAARAGVRNFVVPGTKPEAITIIINTIAGETRMPPVLYAPGFGPQLGNLKAVREAIGENWHAIVGRAIVNAPYGDYARAAEEQIAALIRT